MAKHFTLNQHQHGMHGNGVNGDIEVHWIPPHDIGHGWKRHMVQLEEGDSADNPSSTKSLLYGPCFVVYDVAKTGIRTSTFDTPEEWYELMYESMKEFKARHEFALATGSEQFDGGKN